eukprot:GHVS01006058.1.p1 GENE.GHVS01006058.1~~GHVS01006058.1.p1  ORF type:complete len:476 (-),score=93.69 GHVS01006058.1:520-1947(-)
MMMAAVSWLSKTFLVLLLLAATPPPSPRHSPLLSLLPAVATNTATSSAVASVRQLVASSGGLPVRLSPALYRQFVLGLPKGFQMLVLYSTEDEKVCADCLKINEDFSAIAKNFARESRTSEEERRRRKETGQEEDNTTGGSSSIFGTHGGTGDTIVFALYDLMQDREIVQLHRITTIPFIASITSKSLKASSTPSSSQQSKKATVPFRNQDVYQAQGASNVGGGGVRLLTGRSGGGMEWLNMKTSRKVEVLPPKSHQFFVLVKSILLISCLGILLWLAILLLRAYPILLPLGALFVQLISTCGLFFSVQNSAPFVGKGGVWIAKNGRTQFLGEGLMMSSSTVAAAVTLLLLTFLPSLKWWQEDNNVVVGGKAKKSDCGGKKKKETTTTTTDVLDVSSSNGNNGVVRFSWSWWRCIFFSKTSLKNFVLLFLLCVFVLILNGLLSVYTFKSPWYAPTFLPPGDYIRGELRADRGNEF